MPLSTRAVLTKGVALVNTLYLTDFSAPIFVQKYTPLTLQFRCRKLILFKVLSRFIGYRRTRAALIYWEFVKQLPAGNKSSRVAINYIVLTRVAATAGLT